MQKKAEKRPSTGDIAIVTIDSEEDEPLKVCQIMLLDFKQRFIIFKGNLNFFSSKYVF
jgi:hypothetical protein